MKDALVRSAQGRTVGEQKRQHNKRVKKQAGSTVVASRVASSPGHSRVADASRWNARCRVRMCLDGSPCQSTGDVSTHEGIFTDIC